MTAQPDAGHRRRRFTVEDYRRMAEAGVLDDEDRVELLDGEIVEMTPIGSRHASHVKKIASILRELETDRAILSVQDPIRLGEYSVPKPDLALLRSRDDFYRDAHPEPDDVYLIVEVADTSANFDRTRKLPLYAEQQIPAVWLIDLGEERLEIYEKPVDGEYTVIRKPPFDESVDVLPNAERSVRVGDLFV